MTCNDCIHHGICKYENQQIPLCDLLYCETDHVEKSGCPFEVRETTITQCKKCGARMDGDDNANEN